jgi:plastocyanin
MLRPGNRGSRFALACAVTALGAFAAAGNAWAVAQTIVAADDFYTAANYTMDQGDKAPFQNAGIGSHDVTSRSDGPDAQPLFFTPSMGTGTATVAGTQYLTAGSYPFFCSVHPLTMSGSLVVSGNGAPVARPKIAITVTSSSIATVAKKGKLLLKVQGLAQSDGVTLTAKLGKATIGTQKAFSVATGASKKLTMKLTKSGKSKLAAKKSAKVTITGAVPFGSPASGKKTLN